MPVFYRAQVSLAYDSAIPRDASVNTYHVRNLGQSDFHTDDLNAIEAALQIFYGSIQSRLSDHLQLGPHRIKIFNMVDAPPRAPLRDSTFTLGVTGAGGVPNEVAICLSYRGALASGTNRRRNSGRVYLGPFAASAVEESVGDSRVAAAVRTDIIDGVTGRLLPWTPQPAVGELEWCVFSRSDALGLDVGEPMPEDEPTYTEAQLGAGYKEIVTAWVDDAFDTQRRRGLTPTTRTTTP